MRDNKKKLKKALDEHDRYADDEWYWVFDEEDTYWDWDWSDYYHLFFIPSMFCMAPGSDGYIKEQLGRVQRDHGTPKSFKQFKVGSWMMNVDIEYINGKYILPSILDYKSFSITLFEEDPSEASNDPLQYSIATDFRFKSKQWASKFSGIRGAGLTIDELVDIIKRCLRLTELKFME